MFKRISSTLLAVALLLCLTACEEEDNTPGGSTTQSPPTVNSTTTVVTTATEEANQTAPSSTEESTTQTTTETTAAPTANHTVKPTAKPTTPTTETTAAPTANHTVKPTAKPTTPATVAPITTIATTTTVKPTTTAKTTTTSTTTAATTATTTTTAAGFTAAEIQEAANRIDSASYRAFFTYYPGIFISDFSRLSPEDACLFVIHYLGLRSCEEYDTSNPDLYLYQTTVPAEKMKSFLKDVLNYSCDLTTVDNRGEDMDDIWYDSAKNAIVYQSGAWGSQREETYRYKSHTLKDNVATVTMEFCTLDWDLPDPPADVPTGKTGTLVLTKLPNGIIQLTSFKEN